MSSAADEFWIQRRMDAENVDEQYEDMLAGLEVRCALSACLPGTCTRALSLGAFDSRLQPAMMSREQYAAQRFAAVSKGPTEVCATPQPCLCECVLTRSL